jgi:hypothetical protein
MMNRFGKAMRHIGALLLVLQFLAVTVNPGCVLRVAETAYDSFNAPAGIVIGHPSLDAAHDTSVDPCQEHAAFSLPTHEQGVPTFSLQFDAPRSASLVPNSAVEYLSANPLRLPSQLAYAPLEIPPIISL